MATKVAVIGASGIGKHHAKWWALEGAEVAAFAGTSPESVARTKESLAKLFAFTGRAYTSVAEMLDAEKPGIVDVCSPAPCHAVHVRAALEAGCHVLCEKPFVFDLSLPRERLLDEANELVRLAQSKGARLGVCTQYAAGGRTFARIWQERRGGESITEYHGHMESPAKNRPPDPERVWVDLSPHPISVLLRLLPGCEVRWDTLHTSFGGYEGKADFDVRTAGGHVCHCSIIVRNALEPPLNVRHFKCNGYAFEVEGQNDDQGVYCARIETPDGNCLEPDMIRLLIRNFLEGTATTTMEEALMNLDMMLRILETSRSRHAED